MNEREFPWILERSLDCGETWSFLLGGKTEEELRVDFDHLELSEEGRRALTAEILALEEKARTLRAQLLERHRIRKM